LQQGGCQVSKPLKILNPQLHRTKLLFRFEQNAQERTGFANTAARRKHLTTGARF
jgi:hypothetical protein